MKKLYVYAVLLLAAVLSSVSCSKDKSDPQIGGVELLYGSWGLVGMKITVLEQTVDVPADHSMSVFTFYENGDLEEYQAVYDATAYAVWTYDRAGRRLVIVDKNYDTTLDCAVLQLDDSRLVLEGDVAFDIDEFPDLGSVRTTMTYERISSRSFVAVRSDGVVPVFSSVVEFVK